MFSLLKKENFFSFVFSLFSITKSMNQVYPMLPCNQWGTHLHGWNSTFCGHKVRVPFKRLVLINCRVSCCDIKISCVKEVKLPCLIYLFSLFVFSFKWFLGFHCCRVPNKLVTLYPHCMGEFLEWGKNLSFFVLFSKYTRNVHSCARLVVQYMDTWRAYK